MSSYNCPHSSQADKVHQPCQILLKVIILELATEKYIQIAVALVSAKCSPDHGECAKMCFPNVPAEAINFNKIGCHFVFIKITFWNLC